MNLLIGGFSQGSSFLKLLRILETKGSFSFSLSEKVSRQALYEPLKYLNVGTHMEFKNCWIYI